ncbi:hypothetical protein [Nocardia sp. NPDC004860]|uniref:hypothetical protein n=1 Tax=Nocardia sp. NPDC004860 TaxID=3154557 RepID=UPI0033B20B89
MSATAVRVETDQAAEFPTMMRTPSAPGANEILGIFDRAVHRGHRPDDNDAAG